MKITKKWLKANWQAAAFSLVSLVLIALFSFYNLKSITNTYLSMPEIDSINSATSGQLIWDNPLFLPYKLLQYAILKAGIGSVITFRALSASLGIVLILVFYRLNKLWFSKKIAIVTTIMLMSSGLYLNFSRLATPDILVPLGLTGLLWSAWYIFQKDKSKHSLWFLALILSASIYIPGLIWFTLLVVLIQRKHLTTLYKKLSTSTVIITAAILLILVAPLIRAILINNDLFLHWLALPTNIQWPSLVQNLLFVPASLVVRAPLNPVFNLGHLPYLDVMSVCLVVLGIYAFLLRLDLVRTKTLIGAVLISWFLVALNNLVQINIFLPLIYLTIAAGIMFMLQQWYFVFPKNPIARNLGLIMLVAIISISVYYNTVRYFVAWANNPVSQQSFDQDLSPSLIQ